MSPRPFNSGSRLHRLVGGSAGGPESQGQISVQIGYPETDMNASQWLSMRQNQVVMSMRTYQVCLGRHQIALAGTRGIKMSKMNRYEWYGFSSIP